jgi:hypothetical protein
MTEAEQGRISEKVDTVARDVGKLWTEHRVLSSVVQGPDGTNGIKSRVGSLEDWKEKHMEASGELRKELAHYFDVKRENTCHGIKALDDHIAQHIKLAEAAAASKESKLKAFVQSWGQLLQFAGILGGALISAYVAITLAGK